MISFLNELIESGSQRQVTVVHADRRLDTWPLREEMTALVEKLPHGKLVTFMEDEEPVIRGAWTLRSWAYLRRRTYTCAARCRS